MTPNVRLLAVAVPSLLVSCTPPASLGARPFQDEWESVTASFDYRESMPNIWTINTMSIGSSSVDEDNFNNRGDVVVSYTGEDGEIVIKMRRFVSADSKEDAESEFMRMHLWAYASSNFGPIDNMDPADNCLKEWKDSCNVRLWYDGMSQPVRSGTDFQVILPASYHHAVVIGTSDNDTEDTYLNRGDVCVEQSSGSVNVTLQYGEAYVIIADDITEAPTCAPADLTTCDASGWSSEPGMCPCYERLGAVSVANADATGANMTVDFPKTLWVNASARNNDADQNPAGYHCEAELLQGSIPDADVMREPSSSAWIAGAAFNHPGPDAISGAGFRVSLQALDCSEVKYIDSPSAWEKGKVMLAEESRGNLTACEGCLTGKTCADLVPHAVAN